MLRQIPRGAPTLPRLPEPEASPMIRYAIQEDSLKALVSQRTVREFLIRRHDEARAFSVRLGVN